MAEVEKRFAQACDYREKYSELTGSFHTEIGSLNESIQFWHYRDLTIRARLRVDAAKDANWSLKIGEFIGADVRRALAATGHDIVDESTIAFGGSQMILRLPRGYAGASDPRKDGMAAGH